MTTNPDSQKWQEAIQKIQTAQDKLSPEELSAFNALVEFYNSGNFGASESSDYIQVLKQSGNKNRLLQKVLFPKFVELCEQSFNAQASFNSPFPTTSSNPQPTVNRSSSGGTIPVFQPPVFTPPTRQVSASSNTTPTVTPIEVPQSVNGNTKQWSSATPGYIIFLIDQSGSMKETYPVNGNKANFTAMVINRTINELININMDGAVVKDRVYITLIGYGVEDKNPVKELKTAKLSEYANNPLRIENKKQKVSDGNGGLVEIEVKNPIFIEPLAYGWTPMGEALALAKQKIKEWLNQHPEYPAPVVINISDGLPNDGINSSKKSEDAAIQAAREIMTLSCEDGQPILFNAHIGDSKEKCICSASESELPDEQAKFLFKISSIIPDSYKDAAKKQDLNIKLNSKGFVSNAAPETFINFINFGSSGGKRGKMS